MVVCCRALECSLGVCRRWFSQSTDGGFSLCCALILAWRETEWGYLFTILHNTHHNVLISILCFRCHSAAALHQVCPCWYKLLGSWRWSPKTSTSLYWYTPLYFPLQTKTKLELLLNFKIVGPSLEKTKLFFVNDDKIKVGIKWKFTLWI